MWRIQLMRNERDECNAGFFQRPLHRQIFAVFCSRIMYTYTYSRVQVRVLTSINTTGKFGENCVGPEMLAIAFMAIVGSATQARCVQGCSHRLGRYHIGASRVTTTLRSPRNVKRCQSEAAQHYLC